MSLESILKYGLPFALGKVAPDTPGDYSQRLRIAAEKLFLTLAAELKAVDANDDLSFEGKTKKKVAIAEAALAGLKELGASPASTRLIEKLTRAQAAYDAAIPGNDPDSPSHVLREIEIRQRLDAMDKSERLAAIRKADPLTLSAVRNAPSFVTYVNPDVLNAIADDLVASIAPDKALALKTAREAKGEVDRMLQASINAVTTAVNLEPDSATRIRNIGGGAAA